MCAHKKTKFCSIYYCTGYRSTPCDHPGTCLVGAQDDMAVRCFKVVEYFLQFDVIGIILDFFIVPFFPEHQKVICGGKFSLPCHGSNQLYTCALQTWEFLIRRRHRILEPQAIFIDQYPTQSSFEGSEIFFPEEEARQKCFPKKLLQSNYRISHIIPGRL